MMPSTKKDRKKIRKCLTKEATSPEVTDEDEPTQRVAIPFVWESMSYASNQVWSGQRIQRFSQDSTKEAESQSDQECHWDDHDPTSKGHSQLGNLYNLTTWWLNRSEISNLFINQSLCAIKSTFFSVFVNGKHAIELLSTSMISCLIFL